MSKICSSPGPTFENVLLAGLSRATLEIYYRFPFRVTNNKVKVFNLEHHLNPSGVWIGGLITGWLGGWFRMIISGKLRLS